MTNTNLSWLLAFGLTFAFFILDPGDAAAQRPSLSTILDRLNDLETDVATLQADNAVLQADNDALQLKLANVSVNTGTIGGKTGPHLVINGANFTCPGQRNGWSMYDS